MEFRQCEYELIFSHWKQFYIPNQRVDKPAYVKAYFAISNNLFWIASDPFVLRE